MPVTANTGATLFIGHESARQRLGLSCRTSSCTKISNAQVYRPKFLAPVTPELASNAVLKQGVTDGLGLWIERAVPAKGLALHLVVGRRVHASDCL